MPRSPSPYRRPVNRKSEETFQRIAGWPSVEALFAANVTLVERLYFEGRMEHAVQPLLRGLARARKLYRSVGPEELTRLAGTDMHGGIVAFARPRPIRPITVTDFKALGAKGVGLLMLDGVGNPQNIGAIARTAAFFGVRHLVLSDHEAQAGPSDAAYRIAKGGLEHVELRRIAETPETLTALRPHYQVVGTALETGDALAGAVRAIRATARPVLLVLGNEEHGMPAATLDACERVVRVAGKGLVQSLNVSVTAGIVIHALLAPGPT